MTQTKHPEWVIELALEESNHQGGFLWTEDEVRSWNLLRMCWWDRTRQWEEAWVSAHRNDYTLLSDWLYIQDFFVKWEKCKCYDSGDIRKRDWIYISPAQSPLKSTYKHYVNYEWDYNADWEYCDKVRQIDTDKSVSIPPPEFDLDDGWHVDLSETSTLNKEKFKELFMDISNCNWRSRYDNRWGYCPWKWYPHDYCCYGASATTDLERDKMNKTTTSKAIKWMENKLQANNTITTEEKHEILQSIDKAKKLWYSARIKDKANWHSVSAVWYNVDYVFAIEWDRKKDYYLFEIPICDINNYECIYTDSTDYSSITSQYIFPESSWAYLKDVSDIEIQWNSDLTSINVPISWSYNMSYDISGSCSYELEDAYDPLSQYDDWWRVDTDWYNHSSGVWKDFKIYYDLLSKDNIILGNAVWYFPNISKKTPYKKLTLKDNRCIEFKKDWISLETAIQRLKRQCKKLNITVKPTEHKDTFNSSFNKTMTTLNEMNNNNFFKELDYNETTTLVENADTAVSNLTNMREATTALKNKIQELTSDINQAIDDRNKKEFQSSVSKLEKVMKLLSTWKTLQSQLVLLSDKFETPEEKFDAKEYLN